MRRRITKALLAAAAAGATIASLGLAASPAGASTHPLPAGAFTPSGGTPIGSGANCGGSIPASISDLINDPGTDTVGFPRTDCAQAGYQASGRDFRFAQGLQTVPDHAPDPGTDPWLYVGLDSSTSTTYDFARTGIAWTGSTWVAFFWVVSPSLNNPVFAAFPLAAADQGDGVLANVYLTPQGALQFTATLPDGTVDRKTVSVTGETYVRAQAVADWALPAIVSGSPQPPPVKTRDTQFLAGRFTTVSGAGGTGFSGPWTLNAVEATSNGTLPPTGALIAQPSYLWSDGHGAGDAFGVWRFPF